MSAAAPCLRRLGVVAYEPTFEAMRQFTHQRTEETADEVWLLQHPPVYTLGQAGRIEHLLRPTSIPTLKVDRGGQVTYHGPGQLLVYLLLDLRRRRLKVRELVQLLEQVIIDCLGDYDLVAVRQAGAPGVYVGADKIGALGLRVRNGCSYHGLSLNVDMNLEPYDAINPCGYPGLKTVQLRDFGVDDDVDAVGERLFGHLCRLLAQL